MKKYTYDELLLLIKAERVKHKHEIIRMREKLAESSNIIFAYHLLCRDIAGEVQHGCASMGNEMFKRLSMLTFGKYLPIDHEKLTKIRSECGAK